MIGRLSIVIKFENQLLDKTEFKRLRESANKNLLENFVNLVGMVDDNYLNLIDYYQNKVKNHQVQYIEELFTQTQDPKQRIFPTFDFNEEKLNQSIEFSIEHTKKYDGLAFECNFDQ